MKSIYSFYIYSFMDFLQLIIFLKLSYRNFISGDVVMFILCFGVFVVILRESINKQINFGKYYPLFEEKWLN